nr:MAG TPA: hypothetical protein [Ackermannviridae sp.]
MNLSSPILYLYTVLFYFYLLLIKRNLIEAFTFFCYF